MSPWLPATLASLLLFGLWGFFAKLAARAMGSSSALVYQVLGGLAVGLLAWARLGFRVETRPAGVAFAALTGAAGVLGTYFFYEALRRGGLAVVTLSVALYPVVTIALAMLFLQEALSLRQAVGVGCALLAIYLLQG